MQRIEKINLTKNKMLKTITREKVLKNIAFIEQRLKIQAKEGYNPWMATNGRYKEKQYHPLDIGHQKYILTRLDKLGL